MRSFRVKRLTPNFSSTESRSNTVPMPPRSSGIFTCTGFPMTSDEVQIIADDIRQRARELFNAIGGTNWDITVHTTPDSPNGPAEHNYNISFDEDAVLDIIQAALQKAEQRGRDRALEEAANV